MWEAKRDRTGETQGGCGDYSSLSGAVRLCCTAQVLHVLTPELCHRTPLWLLSLLLLSSPCHPPGSQCSQLSTAKLRNTSGRWMVWKIPSTPQQAWQGAGRVGKKVGIFIWDFYYSGSNLPESCIKPENGEVKDMWTHKLKQELRSMK